ncbi:syntaxin-112 [Bidens hawaiensis]|uniref:syntaxin-112 n=1 Tax=Bidens hawaiensis TaxID=980011 RepID=UPI00404B41D5
MNDLMTKSFLSYADLKKQAQIDIKSQDIELGFQDPNLSKFFQEIDAVKSTMEEIASLLSNLQALNEETKSTHSRKVLRGLRDRMESDMTAVLRKSNVVLARLECLESSPFKDATAVNRTRVLVTSGLRTKLKKLMTEFQDLRDKIVSDHKDYLKRRYFNETGEYPSDEMMETMVSGSGKVFEMAEEGKMDLVMENKERHEAVMDLNKSLSKLHQVFLDMAVLVEAQGESLNDIEDNVAKAGSFVSGGTDGLLYAKQMKDKQRRNSWVCLVWSLVIIVVVVCCIAMLSAF